MEFLICPKESPLFYFFSSLVPQLLYYSHIPAIIISLLLGFFVIFKNKNFLKNKLIFLIFISFTLWAIFDLIVWASNIPGVVLFFWSMQILVEPLIFGFGFYFIYIFINEKDISFKAKILFILFYLPIIIFLPTSNTIEKMFINVACEGQEGFMAVQYVYSFEAIIILLSFIYFLKKYNKFDNLQKKKYFYVTSGTIFFLVFFFLGNLTGSLTDNWDIAQYGILGLTIFSGFLTYAIVKYKALNIKLASAQALVVGMFILVGSQFFFIRSNTNRILNMITLTVVSIFGSWLVKSVKNEIQQKEYLAMANARLKKLDSDKSEFLSIASHQLRTPLTGIKGYLSMILEGDFGPFSDKIKNVVQDVFQNTDRLTRLVNIFLNVSRIESGRFQIDRHNVDLSQLIDETLVALKIGADQKKIKLIYNKPKTALPILQLDKDKMKDVLLNLVDNAIKYTPKGQIEVIAEQINNEVQVKVKDTGIGIPAGEDKELFKKFVRGEGVAQINTGGSGLGLFIVKKIIEAHGGKVWVESAGKDQGSTFIFTIPV